MVSCEKEYSYEGGGIIAVPVTPIDSTGTGDPFVPEFHCCSFCNQANELNESEWSFKIDTSFLCGTVDTAIINFERTAFTFFGPSHCAGDTGLIFTVFLDPYVLNKDTYNYTAPYASFYYYRTGYPNLLANHTDQSFTLTIRSYIHATRMATGVFTGTGYRPNGTAALVYAGKFKIMLR